jgi:hypothetical protein
MALLLLIELAPPPASPEFRQPQMAPFGKEAVLTFGAGNSIYFTRTEKNGTALGAVIKVADTGALYLGRHRGPRIAVAGSTLVISAVAGQKGRGQDGDVLVWTSADKGRTWYGPAPVSQPAGVAREGLHGMAARGSLVFVAWLDLRESKTQIYGSVSRDAGATWSANTLIYKSPSGSVCECCHPTVAIDRQGDIVVMFRNSLEGNRDMYIVRSSDGGLTFSQALKLGEGFWPLNACPMDGGDVNLDDRGEVLTIWRTSVPVLDRRQGTAAGRGQEPLACVCFQRAGGCLGVAGRSGGVVDGLAQAGAGGCGGQVSASGEFEIGQGAGRLGKPGENSNRPFPLSGIRVE